MKDCVGVLVFHNAAIVHRLLPSCFSAKNGGHLNIVVQVTKGLKIITAVSFDAWNSSISWRGNSAQTSPFITTKASGLPALIWSRKWWRPPAVPSGEYSCKYRTDTWNHRTFFSQVLLFQGRSDLLVFCVHVCNKWSHLRRRVEAKQENLLDVRHLGKTMSFLSTNGWSPPDLW